MAEIKDFLRCIRNTYKIQRLTLPNDFGRYINRNNRGVTSRPLIIPKQNSSLSFFLHLKTFNFRRLCMTGLVILFVLICPSLVFSEGGVTLSPEEEEIIGGEMDIRQLMQVDVTVTSVSKRPELVHKAASAIYVLTQEDIRRSGAVNIMEALRMVPGVLVSKLNQNRYAISIRGFNQRLGSDKLLVLMDGRSVYSPVQSGVFWIGQDTVLEDIERIEVIRGPGAALWGSNAVAGVINIITKSAEKTQGSLVAGGVGTEEEGFATLRFGGNMGGKIVGGELKNEFNYRVYAKYRDRDDGIAANGNDAFDDKQIGQGGFRSDWQINERDSLTMQGDYYRLNSNLDFSSRFVSAAAGSAPFQGTNIQEGANFLTRWNRTIDDHSSYSLQVYYDRLKRKSGVPFDNVVDQFDIDFQHNIFLAGKHNISWGLNYRYAFFDLETTNIIQINQKDSHLASFFLHDEIELVPDELSLILGSKFEYNIFSGLEIQPSVRMAWNPQENHTIWAAFSRAVRLPTVSDENATVNQVRLDPPISPFPLILQQVPNTGAKAEVLLAYELGYRVKINKTVNFDITAYYFDYDRLIESEDVNFIPGPVSILQSQNGNILTGEVYGLEVSGQWQVLPNWRLSGSYTFADTQLHNTSSNLNFGSTNAVGDFEAELEPRHIFNIRSYLNLPHNLELDTFYYYVTSRSSSTSQNPFVSIPAYGRLDVRLGWQATDKITLSFAAQNLLDESHPELSETLEVPSETQRSYYVKATLKF